MTAQGSASDRVPALAGGSGAPAAPQRQPPLSLSEILDVCDQLLDETGRRRHRFAWLRPPGSGVKDCFEVDAYYPGNRVVVCAGLTPEQYELCRELVPGNGLALLELRPDEFGPDREMVEGLLQVRIEALGPRPKREGSYAAPAPKSSAAAPVPKGPSAAPAPKVPSAAPAPKVPSAAPLPEGPSAAPVPKGPSAAPATKVPSAAPLPEGPSAAPVREPVPSLFWKTPAAPARGGGSGAAARPAPAQRAPAPAQRAPAPALVPPARRPDPFVPRAQHQPASASRSAPPPSAGVRPTAAGARPAYTSEQSQTSGLFLGLVLGLVLLTETLVLLVGVGIGGGLPVLALAFGLDASARALGAITALRDHQPGPAWACVLIGSPAVLAFTLTREEGKEATEPGPLAAVAAGLALAMLALAILGMLLGV